MSTAPFPIVDGHLDLAENVTIFGRDLTSQVSGIRQAEKRTSRQATVSLPEMERGGIAVGIATVTPGFKATDVPKGAVPDAAIYRRPEEAEAQALSQVELYWTWEANGRVRLIRSAADLEDHLLMWRRDRKPGLVLLMESADAIRDAGDLSAWWKRGLRIIGLTYGDTRYGTGVGGGSRAFKSGGLTEAGLELLRDMAGAGIAWDISHLTDEGIWQGLDLGMASICASHANARALVPTDRHLSDEILRAVGVRGGVIGLVLYNGFLDPDWKRGGDNGVSLERDLRRHADHIAAVCGWESVGIGSDLDGGFGLEESPQEVETIADLCAVGTALPEAHRADVLGGNWLRFLRRTLPR